MRARTARRGSAVLVSILLVLTSLAQPADAQVAPAPASPETGPASPETSDPALEPGAAADHQLGERQMVTEQLALGAPAPAPLPDDGHDQGTTAADDHADDDHADNTDDDHDAPVLGTSPPEPVAVATAESSTAVSDETFALVGVTSERPVPAEGVWLRARRTGEGWGEWFLLPPADGGEDAPEMGGASADAPTATDPVWVGEATEVEVRAGDVDGMAAVVVREGDEPLPTPAEQDGLQATTSVDAPAAPTSPEQAPTADGLASSTEAATLSSATPHRLPVPVYTRSEWGARGPKEPAPVVAGPKLGIVHHSVNTNSYSAAQVPSMLRGIQAYHMDANGWSDIAYNFVVDRYGRVWEARNGSLNANTVGGHARGFNTGSVGVVFLGEHGSSGPTGASLDVAGKILGWRLASGGVDPRSTVVYTTYGNEVFAPGTPVALPAVAGHRNTGSTACPGGLLYSQLARIRSVAGATFDQVTPPFGRTEGVRQIGPSRVQVTGFALDPDAGSGSIDVHVYADGKGAAVTRTSIPRGDVRGGWPWATGLHGWSAEVSLSPGRHQLCAYAINVGPGRNAALGCLQVDVGGSPIGGVEALRPIGPGQLRLEGHAADLDTTGPVDVHTYFYRSGVAGVVASSTTVTDVDRPDLASRYPYWPSERGWRSDVVLPPGSYVGCAFAIDPQGGPARKLGCVGGSVPTGAPFGSFEGAALSGPRNLTISGWAVDPDSTGQLDVHVYAFRRGSATPTHSATTRTTRARPDLADSLPGWEPERGFVANLAITPGEWVICAYGIDPQGRSNGVLRPCLGAVVPSNPFGGIDTTTPAGAGKLAVEGWGLDPDVAGAIDVHLYAARPGKAFSRSVTTSTTLDRPDIKAAWPGWDLQRGYRGVMDLGSGTWVICAFGINVGAGSNSSLGCVQAVVPSGSPSGKITASGPLGAGAAMVTGWAVDPDTDGAIDVHLYLRHDDESSPSKVVTGTADDAAPLPEAPWAAWGEGHGFSLQATGLRAGRWNACAYGINRLAGGNVLLGCKSITLA